MSDTITKSAIFGGVALVSYFIYNKVINKDNEPQTRKQRQAFTLSDMDNQIDKRNHAFGGKKIMSNPKVPFYSRHNQNRRRRLSNNI